MTEFTGKYFTLAGSPLWEKPRLAGKPFNPGALNRDFSWRTRISGQQRQAAEELLPHCDPIRLCPICADPRHSLFVTVYDFPYHECGLCGHIYCSLVPNQEKLEQLYSGVDHLSAIQQSVYLDDEIYRERVKAIATPKVAWVQEVVGHRGKWLDIGSGAGEILQAARDAGFTVTGIESDRVEADFARSRGFEVRNDFVDESNAGDICGTADVVSLINVLEHARQPRRLLAALSEAARIGTSFVFELPRHPSISSFSCLAFPDIACRHIYPPDHLHIFSERSIHNMLEGLPLSIAAVWNFGQDVSDLLQSVAVSREVNLTPFVDQILKSAGKLQLCCDTAGLSDTIILVCTRVASAGADQDRQADRDREGGGQ